MGYFGVFEKKWKNGIFGVFYKNGKIEYTVKITKMTYSGKTVKNGDFLTFCHIVKKGDI